MPKNSSKLKRLDCAVLNFYLKALEEAGLVYDTVRCAFQEGQPYCREAEFTKKATSRW